MADSSRQDVLLRIQAQDLSSADVNKVASAVDSLTDSLDSNIAAANKGTISLGELKSQMTQLEQAGKGLTSVAALIDRFNDLNGVVGQNAAKVTAAQAALTSYRAQVEGMSSAGAAEEARLSSLVKQLTSSEAAYQRNSAALQSVQSALQQSGVDTTNLGATQERLASVADQVGSALTKLNQAQLNYAQNSRLAKQAAADLAQQQQQTAASIAAQASQQDAQNKVAASAVAAQASANAAGLKAAQQGIAQMQAQRDQAAAANEAKERANTARLIGLQIQTNTDKAAAQAKADAAAAAEAKTAADAQVKAYQDEQARIRAIIANARNPQTTTPGTTPGAAPGTPAAPKGGTPATTPATVLGLKPYEIQNLSYQINDVVTQLASGTKASQVFAQQGGQILQLWVPNLLSLKSYILPIGVGIAALTVIVETLNRAFAEQSSLREFTAALQANADGLKYQAAQLVAIQQSVKQYGVGWAEAGQLINTAVQGGIAENRIPQLIKLSQNIADVTGTKVPDAMKLLVSAFTKGTSGVIDLNNSLGTLTKTQFDQINSLEQSGQVNEANALLLDILTKKYNDAANTAVSPFTKATRDLKTAWSDLLTTLANSSVIQGIVASITTLVTALDSAAKGADAMIKSFNTFSQLKVPPGYFGSSALYSAVSTARAMVGNTTGIQNDLAASGQQQAFMTAAQNNGLITGAFTPNGLKIDTTSLQQLATILSSDEVKAALPPGAMIQAISSERPGAVVAHGSGAGQPSEHATGNAIDVRVVDASGKPIDLGVTGQMGAGAPNVAIDAAVVAAAKRLYPDQPVAVGSTFKTNYDPGHYSMGGQEAVNNAASRGDLSATVAQQQAITQELAKQQIAGTDLLNQDTLRTLQANNYTKANQDAAIQLQGQLAYQQAFSQTQSQSVAKAHEDEVVQQLKTEQYKTQAQYAQEDLTRRAQQKQFGDQVAAAGVAAAAAYVAQAQAAGTLVSLGDVRKAQLDGENAALAKLQDTERSRAEVQAAQNQLASLQRQNSLKQIGDISAAVAAVDQQYTAYNASLDKIVLHNPALADQVAQLRAAGDASRTAAEGNAQLKAYIDGANAAANTRNDLTQTYKALLDAGAISQDEFESKSQAAYAASASSIADISTKFSQFVATTKGLDPTQVELYTAKMKELGAQAAYVSPLMKAVKDAIGTGFQEGVSEGFNTIAQAIGNVIAKTGSWKDVLNSIPQAIGQVFSVLFKDIAEAILKYEALKVASALGLTGGGGGGLFGSLFSSAGGAAGGAAAGAGDAASAVTAGAGGSAGFFSFLGFHTGGIVGRGGSAGQAPASWWAGAPRYHAGTVVGLRPDEQTAILKKGEEVLSTHDPRNIMNGGGSSTSPVNIRSVLVLDNDLIPQAMSGSQGEKIVLSHIQKNAATVRQLVR